MMRSKRLFGGRPRLRIVIWQCKECKRVWAVEYDGSKGHPVCPDCGSQSIYVAAL